MLEIFKIGVQCDDSAVVNIGELAREHKSVGPGCCAGHAPCGHVRCLSIVL